MPRKWMRIAAYVVCQDERGRFLLTHLAERTGVGQWTLPGGGIDPGEHPEDGALREVTEESAYTGALDALLGVDAYHIVTDDRDDYSVRIIYRGRVTGGELTAESDGSTDGAAWFHPDEIDHRDAVPLVAIALGLSGRSARPLPPRSTTTSRAASAGPPPAPVLHGTPLTASAGRPPTLVAHGVVTAADGRVLLVRQPGPGPGPESWDLPGGPAVHGEPVETAVARLVAHVAGVDVRAGATLTVGTDDVDGATAIRVTCLAPTDAADRPERPGVRWSTQGELVRDELTPAARTALGLLPADGRR